MKISLLIFLIIQIVSVSMTNNKNGLSKGKGNGLSKGNGNGQRTIPNNLMAPNSGKNFYSSNSNIYLVLVNKKHKLPDNWLDLVELVPTKNSLSREFEVEWATLKHFEALRKKLLKEGIDIELDSTYRSVKAQEELWAEFEKLYGRDYCEKYVAVPGFSEHHTGLVVDVCLIKNGKVIDDNDEMIAEREIFAKVHSHLADYGFILRYMEGKENITGYSYEPWHFRYVGKQVAKEIKRRNITLEEYLGEI